MLTLTISSLFTTLVFGHGNAHNKAAHKPNPEKVESEDILDRINKAYLKDVKPIFTQKCMDCHSNRTRYPWYHSLPILQNIIDQDIAEGREHLDLSSDYPFGGHGSPEEDLDAIKEAIRDDSMPPLAYKLMHWSSRITHDEKETIMRWVDNSKKALEKELGN